MKTTRSFVFMLCIYAVLFTGCKKNNIAESKYYHFDTTFQLVNSPIKINEILQPVHLVLMKDYIIVANDPSNGQSVFNIYRREDFKFLYGFGTHGRGPIEYISFTTPQHTEDNILPVFNNVTDMLVRYEISDTTETALSSKRLKIKALSPVQCLALVNDSIMLYSVHNQSDTKTYSYNINTNKPIGSIDFISPYRKKFNKSLDGYMFDYKDGVLVAAFEYLDEVVMIKLNDDYSFPENEVLLKNYSPLKEPEQKTSSNTAYYTFPYIGDKYIFIERIGRPMKELNPFHIGRNFRLDIDVFDLDLNPVAKFKFKDNIMKFVVDEKKSTIYSWDIMGNFDYVDSYHYNL